MKKGKLKTKRDHHQHKLWNLATVIIRWLWRWYGWCWWVCWCWRPPPPPTPPPTATSTRCAPASSRRASPPWLGPVGGSCRYIYWRISIISTYDFYNIYVISIMSTFDIYHIDLLYLKYLLMIYMISIYNIYHIYLQYLSYLRIISIISTQHNYTADTQLHAIQSLLQAPVDIREVSCLGVPFAQIPGEHINITCGRLRNSSQHCWKQTTWLQLDTSATHNATSFYFPCFSSENNLHNC